MRQGQSDHAAGMTIEQPSVPAQSLGALVPLLIALGGTAVVLANSGSPGYHGTPVVGLLAIGSLMGFFGGLGSRMAIAWKGTPALRAKAGRLVLATGALWALALAAVVAGVAGTTSFW